MMRRLLGIVGVLGVLLLVAACDDSDDLSTDTCGGLCAKMPAEDGRSECVQGYFKDRGYATLTVPECTDINTQAACNGCVGKLNVLEDDCKTADATCFNP